MRTILGELLLAAALAVVFVLLLLLARADEIGKNKLGVQVLVREVLEIESIFLEVATYLVDFEFRVVGFKDLDNLGPILLEHVFVTCNEIGIEFFEEDVAQVYLSELEFRNIC